MRCSTRFSFKSVTYIIMFYECQDSYIEIYGDDTTPYACASDIDTVISVL